MSVTCDGVKWCVANGRCKCDAGGERERERERVKEKRGQQLTAAFLSLTSNGLNPEGNILAPMGAAAGPPVKIQISLFNSAHGWILIPPMQFLLAPLLTFLHQGAIC